MPQAMLPDLNTAYIKYRNLAIANLTSKNYGLCTTALYAINGLLPEDYRVKISTAKYNEMTIHKPSYTCYKCNKEINAIEVFEKLTPMIVSVIAEESFNDTWSCPECGNDNSLEETDIVFDKLDKPYYLKLVPEPPDRKDGVIDRTAYHITYSKWAETMLIELESQMGKFRVDYREANRQSEEYDIDQNFEENDKD